MPRLLLLCFVSGLSFWTAVTASAAPAAQRTCRILFLGAARDAPESLLLFDGTSAQKVELPRMNLSPIYKLPAGPLILRLLEKQPETAEAIPAGSPQVKIGEGTSDFYLLIANDPKNKVLPVSMQVINADQGSFSKGQMLWFNLTKNRVGGTLGSEKLALEPNSRKISNAPAKGAGDYPVELYYQIPGDKKVWPLCETQWQHNPAGRTVVFVLTEGDSRVPRIMGFPDFRMEEEKERM